MSMTRRTEIAPAPDADGIPQAYRHDWISFTMRRLEPWIAGSIGLYTAWIAIVALPGAALPWVFVAYAALVAKWCKLRPAHYHLEMFLRALALVAGAYVLNMQVPIAADGAGGLFFFWLSITTLYYAFMLKPLWGVALILAAMSALVASQPATGESLWPALAAPLGYLAIFPLGVAMQFGVAMRRTDEAIERGQRNSSTGLYNLEGFLVHGEEALVACADEHKPVSLVVIDCSDLQEVRTIYGSQISRKVMARLVRKLNAIAGERGVAARTAPTEFCLVLPGMTKDKARAAIERVIGRPGCIEYDAGDSEIVMVPTLTVEELDCAPTGLREAYDRQRALLQQHLQDQIEHERYLKLERERYSRPAPLTPLSPMATIPVTMPAPLTSLAPVFDSR